MYKIVSFTDFCDSFSETYRGHFSYEGKRALFDYLEQLEQETGEDIELDIVALCCDYAEYESAQEVMRAYQPDDMPQEGEEGDDLLEVEAKNEAKALEWLQERTTVIPVEGGRIIIQQF